MAYAEVNIGSNDVLEALTYCDHLSNYELRLNENGEKLAELILEMVMQRMKERLGATNA